MNTSIGVGIKIRLTAGFFKHGKQFSSRNLWFLKEKAGRVRRETSFPCYHNEVGGSLRIKLLLPQIPIRMCFPKSNGGKDVR